MQLLLGLLARREVTDHGHDPDGPSAIIPQNGPMDDHREQTSVFADATFLDGPGVGLAADYPRKFTHASPAVLGMRKADVGHGQQFFR